MAKATPPAKPARPAIGLNDLATAGALLLSVFIVYLPAMSGTFLWDDEYHVTRPELQSWQGLWRIWTDLHATQQYYPLLHSAFWMEHWLWGNSFTAYHVWNIVLHATAACLLAAILKKLAIPGAWLAAFLFALHPVSVGSVAWISEQKNTLSTVFYLGSALTYLHFDESRRRRTYVVALLLFALALMSKTVSATLPAALLVVFWWQRGKLDWRKDVMPLAPWLALGAAAGLFTAWVEQTVIGAKEVSLGLSLIDRLMLAGRVIWFYAAKLVWPAGLVFIYPRWTIDTGTWWQYLFPLGVAAAAWGLWIYSKKDRGPLAGFLFFAGTLFPVLGFFNVYPFLFSYVADHFQYVASLGIIVPVAAGMTLVSKERTWFYAAPLLAVLAFLSWEQSGIYRDAETLYRDTVARNPECWMAENNLGSTLLNDPKRLQEAATHVQAAIRLRPDYPEAHTNLGLAFSRMPDRASDAIAEYQTALKIRPDYSVAHYNLGVEYAKLPGRENDAIAEYQIALQEEPGSAQVLSNLGVALEKAPGRLPEAIARYEAALAREPNSAEIHRNLAGAYSTAGRLPEAVAQLQTALRLDPAFAEAHASLGEILAELPGRQQEAIAELRAAIKINPSVAAVHYDLGFLLSDTPGGTSAAEAEYREALRLRPDYAEAHNNLGMLLDDSGRVKEALPELEAAVRLKPESAQGHYNLGFALAKVPGGRERAIRELEIALRLRPDAEPVREMLAKVRAGR